MSQQSPGRMLALIAEEDLSTSQYCIVAMGTADNSVKRCGTADVPLGVLHNKPTAGQAAAVCISGTSLVKANGAFSKGDKLASAAATGKVDTVSGTVNIIGVALEAAGKADVLVEMLLRQADAIATVSPAACEATVTERTLVSYRADGNVAATIPSKLVAIAEGAGVIDAASFALAETGADAANALSLEMDVTINGTSIFTTKPALSKTATDGATTRTAGTGVTVGVIDAAANIVAAGDKIAMVFTATRTASPSTEMSGLFAQASIKSKVGA